MTPQSETVTRKLKVGDQVMIVPGLTPAVIDAVVGGRMMRAAEAKP